MGCSCLSKSNQAPDFLMEQYSKSIKDIDGNPEATNLFQIENKATEPDQAGEMDPKERKKRSSTQRSRRMAQIAAVNSFEEVFENIRKVQKDKSQSEISLICEAFKHNFIFQSLDSEDQIDLVDKMFYCVAKSNEYVFKQGDQASSYFFIDEGKCQIIINEEVKKELGPGDSFGELALLYKAPRSASIFTLQDCGFWAIDRNTFRTFVEFIIQRDFEYNREFVSNVKFFDFLTDTQKDNIASVLLTQRFQQGDTIVNEGDSANSFYIVKKGILSVIKNNKVIRLIEKGESFGEQSLFSNNVRQATVKAEVASICLALSKDDLIKILGDQIQTVMYDNLKRWAIEKNTLLSKLTKIQTEKIVKNSKQREVKAGERVSAKNVLCQKLVFLLEGTIIDSLTKKVFLQKGSIYGEEYLKNDNQDIVTNVELVMGTDGIISEIDFITVIECIGGSLEQTIKKNADSHERYMIRRQTLERDEGPFMDFSKLHLENQIGKGSFGIIYLAKYENDLHSYALKCIPKQKIINQGIQKHVIQEKKILESINFPFLVKFIRSFKDADTIYFLMDYVKGVELFDVIRELGLLGSHDCMFYIGSLILCLEYLHTNYIIYRDIKPENVMIDEKGYIVLLDMGTAKFLKGKSGRTHTVIGTPHYMAPEIMLGKGYTYSSDLWSLGVCLFEFATGMHPFAEGVEDPLKIFQITILKKLTFPTFLGDSKLKKFLTQLLHIQPEVRLGGSYTRMKSHEWFQNFDWDKLIEKQFEAPYIPSRSVLFEKLHSIKPAMQKKEAAQVFRRASIYEDPNWDKDF